MNAQIQKMTATQAADLAAKSGKNCLLFINTANNHLGMIDETGALFHFDTNAFAAGA